jgi:hypothetical protein
MASQDYVDRRKARWREDAYEGGGGDESVEHCEGPEDPVLPRRRAVHVLPPPRDGRRQGCRHRRHHRPASREYPSER